MRSAVPYNTDANAVRHTNLPLSNLGVVRRVHCQVSFNRHPLGDNYRADPQHLFGDGLRVGLFKFPSVFHFIHACGKFFLKTSPNAFKNTQIHNGPSGSIEPREVVSSEFTRLLIVWRILQKLLVEST